MAARDKIITLLRKEQKWAVIPTGTKDLQMSRRLGKQTVTVLLKFCGKGMFSLRPATYRFRSATSHFDYATGERRFSRNKQVLKSLFRSLKESAIAGYILNLDTFLVVNDCNSSSDKDKLGEELKKFTKR